MGSISSWQARDHVTRNGLSHHARARSLQEKTSPRVTCATQIDAFLQAAQPSCSVMIKSCGFAAPPRSGCALRRLPWGGSYAGPLRKTRCTECSAVRHDIFPGDHRSRRCDKEKGPLLRGGPAIRQSADYGRSMAITGEVHVSDVRGIRAIAVRLECPDLDDVLTVVDWVRSGPRRKPCPRSLSPWRCASRPSRRRTGADVQLRGRHSLSMPM